MSGRLTYVGHATVSIELGGVKLLTDPALRDRFLHIRRHAPAAPSAAELGVDAVLVSHLHADHLDLPSLRGLDAETRFVTPMGGAKLLRGRGFERVEEVVSGDVVEIGAVSVRATPAIHDGRRWPIGQKRWGLGFEIRSPEARLYFAGDTDLFAGMRDLAGDLDVAMLPIAGWGPKLKGGHLDPAKAAEAAAMLKPRFVVPIHWGTLLRAGLRRRHGHLLTDPPARLEAEMATRAPDVGVRVLQPGESLEI